MTQAKQGDKVRVHYHGTLDDGTVFDSSLERDPLEFTLGEGLVIPGFESGVAGMEVGEEKKISIAPADAYGERRDDLVGKMPLNALPEDIDPEVGMDLTLRSPEGKTLEVKVTGIDEESLTLDGNHPLAGEALNFDLKLVEIL